MKHLVLILTLLCSFSALAKDLSHQAQLRRVSFILAGRPPSHFEMKEIEEMNEEEFAEYLSQFVQENLDSEKFTEQFHRKIQNLFQFYLMSSASYSETEFRSNNAFDNLVEKILNENRPWRELLTAQEYEASLAVSFQSRGDLLFFQFVFYDELGEELENYVQTPESQSFNYGAYEEDEKRIPLVAATPEQKQTLAGVITTQRFFGRYNTTKINKNRGRAAAIFRTFLCDPMKPIVLTSDEEDNELLSKSLQMEQAHSGAEISQDLEARHGSDPQCMACHYKLDPMANVFAGSSLVLNPFAAPGALVFKNHRGEKVEEEVLGFKGLADAIVAQEDYKACQVQHFWNWVIGEDIPLDAAHKQELVQVFTDLDEKPKDFVKHLVLSEAFKGYESLREEDIRYSHVRPIFQRCDSCHHGEALAPTLSEGYPFAAFYDAMYGMPLVEKIVEQTDLLHRSANAKMPPKKAGWSLRPEERDLLLAWVRHGAKDDQGQVQLENSAAIDTLSALEYEQGFKDELEPTFYNTFSRLLAGETLLQVLQTTYAGRASGCNFSDESDRNTVGFPMATDGRPIFKYVNPNYLQWWLRCLDTNQNTMELYYNENYDEFVESGLTPLGKGQKWNTLSLEVKEKIFIAIERHVLGYGVLSDESRQRLFDNVDRKLGEKDLMTYQAMVTIAQTLLSTRHYLTY